MEIFEGLKKAGVLVAIILLIVGVSCLLMPYKIAKILATLVGLIIIIYGIYELVFTFSKRDELVHPMFHTVLGAGTLLAGLFVLFNRGATISLVGIFISICAFMAAAQRFSLAAERKRSNLPSTSTFVFGVVHLCFGIIVFLVPKATAALVVRICGIYILITAVMMIQSLSFVKDEN